MEINSNFLDALGFTLVDSLWQGLIVMAVAFLGLAVMAKAPARWRHNFLLVCILALPIGGLYSFSQHQNFSTDVVDNVMTSQAMVPNTSGINVVDDGLSTVSKIQTEAFWLVDKAHWIGLLWMIGLVLVSLRGIGGMLYLKRLKSNAMEIQQPEIINLLRELTEDFGLHTTVLIKESSKVMSPLVSGYFKPIILFPLGLIQGLTTEEVEVILLHELAHLKRNDFLINIVTNGLRAVYFYHPAYWWLQSQLDNEREYATDEMVMSKQSNGLLLVKALAKTQEYKMTTPSLGFAGNSKNQLLKRVNRIMKKQQSPNWLSGIFAMMLLCTAFILMSQSQQTKKDVKQETPKTLEIGSLQVLNFKPIVLETDSIKFSPLKFADTLYFGNTQRHYQSDSNLLARAIQEIIQKPSPIMVELDGKGNPISIKRNEKLLEGDEFKIYEKAFHQLKDYAVTVVERNPDLLQELNSIENLARLAGINFQQFKSLSNINKLAKMSGVDIIEDSVSAALYEQMKNSYDVLNVQEQMRLMDMQQRTQMLKNHSEQLNAYIKKFSEGSNEEYLNKYKNELAQLEAYMLALKREEQVMNKENNDFLKALDSYRLNYQQQNGELTEYITELNTIIEIKGNRSSAENTREVERQLKALEMEIDEVLSSRDKELQREFKEKAKVIIEDHESSSNPSTYDFLEDERSQREAIQVLSVLRKDNKNSIVVLDGKYMPSKALIKLEEKMIKSITVSKREALKSYSKRKVKGYDSVIDIKTK